MLGNPRLEAGGLDLGAREDRPDNGRATRNRSRALARPRFRRRVFEKRAFRKSDELAEQQDIVTGVAGRYASALFSLARDERKTDEVAAALASFDAAIAGSEDLQRLVRSPVYSAHEQLSALLPILELLGVTGIAANFIKLAAAKRRLFAVRDMIREYSLLNDAFRGVTRAEVTSASALSAANVAALKDALRVASRGKDVELLAKVDPAIIGGLIVQLGSRMVDGSLKTKLNAIRTRMKEVG
jgi:F-type H+-transporting ATPase subunit delta